MVAVLIAALALAFAPTGARTYTIQLDRLLAPTVNGHQIANERDAAHVFGAPTTRSRCTAAWKQAMLAARTAASFPAADEDYFHDMDGGAALTKEQIAGRNMWLVWTGGDDRLWDVLSVNSLGSLDFLNRGTLWQLETGGAMCDGGPTLALAAKLVAGRVAALEVVRVPACG